MTNRPGMRRVARLLFAASMMCIVARDASAQVLQGKWVDEAEASIAKHRMVKIRVVVLDADGKLGAGAKVTLQLQRHLFDVGVIWPQAGVPVADVDRQRPVLRVLNATSLESLTAWATTHPTREGDEGQLKKISDAIAWAREHNWSLRWGPLLLADPGRLPGWVSSAENSAIPKLIDEHITSTLQNFGGDVSQFDLYSSTGDHRYFDEQYGPALLRNLAEHGSATAPHARLGIRFDDALVGSRMSDMRQRMVKREEELQRFDALAVDGNVRGLLASNAIIDVMKWFGRLNRPVVLSKMEVGGPSLSAAALNMETLVRLAFAEPSVSGIYFAGLRADDLSDPTAALLDASGSPTPAGRVLDDLFTHHWRTDPDVVADALGNVRQTVFAGWYQITATLKDGSTATLDVLIKPSDAVEERIIVVQPLRP